METKTEAEVTKDAPVNADVTTDPQKEAEATSKRISTKEIIAYLAEKFPNCFSVKGPAKALKIGIFQDLAEKLTDDDTVSKTRLRQALRHYTSSWRYLKAIKVGMFRVDIEGNDVAEIDQDQADYAAKTLQESQEKFGNKNTKDNHAKKPYKGKKQDNKSEHASSKSKAKFKAVKTTKRAQPAVAAKLTPVAADAVVVGKAVKVQLGNSPLDAVITEISGDDVSVQLNSGMVVKTQIKNIFSE